MEYITTTFVINLTEATERMALIHADLVKNDIPYTRWSATRGSTLSPDEIKQNTSYLCRNALCNNGMIGCYISHLRIWQHIASLYRDVQDKDPQRTWFMIMEDDAKILPGFHENLSKVFQELQSWPSQQHAYPEVIHMSCKHGCNITSITPHIYTLQIFQTMRAYAVSVAGATKLAYLLSTAQFHVDIMLTIKNAYHHKVAIYSTKSYIGNTDQFKSTISTYSFPLFFNIVIIQPLIQLLQLQDNNIHIIFQSPTFSVSRIIDVNGTFFLFIFILALLIHFKQYMWILILLMIEIIITLCIWARMRKIYEPLIYAAL
jgi:GR25 family glycosyltransferase involved in LPS biosynthesis